MQSQNDWNAILAKLSEMYLETKDPRIAKLHAVAMGYAVTDYQKVKESWHVPTRYC